MGGSPPIIKLSTFSSRELITSIFPLIFAPPIIAAQALACIREWGLEDNDARINQNGGAIAIGHPLGVSGTRILQTAAIELQKQNKKYALVTMCIGVGQGYATIIERV